MNSANGIYGIHDFLWYTGLIVFFLVGVYESVTYDTNGFWNRYELYGWTLISTIYSIAYIYAIKIHIKKYVLMR